LLIKNLPLEKEAVVLAEAEDLAESWNNQSGHRLQDGELAVAQFLSQAL
jgi:hypothetical protein